MGSFPHISFKVDHLNCSSQPTNTSLETTTPYGPTAQRIQQFWRKTSQFFYGQRRTTSAQRSVKKRIFVSTPVLREIQCSLCSHSSSSIFLFMRQRDLSILTSHCLSSLTANGSVTAKFLSSFAWV